LGRVGLIKSPAIYESLNGVIFAVGQGADYKLAGPFSASANCALLFSGQAKEDIGKQEIIFSGDFIIDFIQTLEKTRGGMELPAAVTRKIDGLLERKDRLMGLMEKKNPDSHSIQNYLKVEVHQGLQLPVADRSDGIITVRLWPG
jgi:hypothetical protein